VQFCKTLYAVHKTLHNALQVTLKSGTTLASRQGLRRSRDWKGPKNWTSHQK